MGDIKEVKCPQLMNEVASFVGSTNATSTCPEHLFERAAHTSSATTQSAATATSSTIRLFESHLGVTQIDKNDLKIGQPGENKYGIRETITMRRSDLKAAAYPPKPTILGSPRKLRKRRWRQREIRKIHRTCYHFWFSELVSAVLQTGLVELRHDVQPSDATSKTEEVMLRFIPYQYRTDGYGINAPHVVDIQCPLSCNWYSIMDTLRATLCTKHNVIIPKHEPVYLYNKDDKPVMQDSTLYFLSKFHKIKTDSFFEEFKVDEDGVPAVKKAIERLINAFFHPDDAQSGTQTDALRVQRVFDMIHFSYDTLAHQTGQNKLDRQLSKYRNYWYYMFLQFVKKHLHTTDYADTHLIEDKTLLHGFIAQWKDLLTFNGSSRRTTAAFYSSAASTDLSAMYSSIQKMEKILAKMLPIGVQQDSWAFPAEILSAIHLLSGRVRQDDSTETKVVEELVTFANDSLKFKEGGKTHTTIYHLYYSRSTEERGAPLVLDSNVDGHWQRKSKSSSSMFSRGLYTKPLYRIMSEQRLRGHNMAFGNKPSTYMCDGFRASKWQNEGTLMETRVHNTKTAALETKTAAAPRRQDLQQLILVPIQTDYPYVKGDDAAFYKLFAVMEYTEKHVNMRYVMAFDSRSHMCNFDTDDAIDFTTCARYVEYGWRLQSMNYFVARNIFNMDRLVESDGRVNQGKHFSNRMEVIRRTLRKPFAAWEEYEPLVQMLSSDKHRTLAHLVLYESCLHGNVMSHTAESNSTSHAKRLCMQAFLQIPFVQHHVTKAPILSLAVPSSGRTLNRRDDLRQELYEYLGKKHSKMTQRLMHHLLSNEMHKYPPTQYFWNTSLNAKYFFMYPSLMQVHFGISLPTAATTNETVHPMHKTTGGRHRRSRRSRPRSVAHTVRRR